MFVDLSGISPNSVVAVALSGGSDSMALLRYLISVCEKNNFSVVAINIEHGIRGESSVSDSLFVKDYCNKNDIPLISYSVDTLSYIKENKLSVEQGARILRYNCFFDAIANGKCDVVATAHHLRDNLETVLMNIFRGTGLKGLSGITSYSDKIIRPFVGVSKQEIDEFVADNGIPFVTDETNLSDDYTRNFLRHNVLPQIEKVFPDAEKSVYRLSLLSKKEDDFLDGLADGIIKTDNNGVTLSLPSHSVILSRATIKALKFLGIDKDWEKIHIDEVVSLQKKENGKKVVLPKNIVAYKEYDKIVLVKETDNAENTELPFKEGIFPFCDGKIKIEKVNVKGVNLKDGLYLAVESIPENTVVRTKKDGDIFAKFGGGEKKLVDYLTDIKIPLRERDKLPIIANGNTVLAVFGIAISSKAKATSQTEFLYKITKD